jgi:hypothetical protein
MSVLLRPFWPERARQEAAALALDTMDQRFDPLAIRTDIRTFRSPQPLSYWRCFRGRNVRRKVSAPGGSTNGVGRRFRPFEINDLEMVNLIFTSSNPLVSWLRQLDGLRRPRKERMAQTISRQRLNVPAPPE